MKLRASDTIITLNSNKNDRANYQIGPHLYVCSGLTSLSTAFQSYGKSFEFEPPSPKYLIPDNLTGFPTLPTRALN